MRSDEYIGIPLIHSMKDLGKGNKYTFGIYDHNIKTQIFKDFD